MATAVDPERILKDLAKLWVDLAKEESEKNSAGVLRACAMTLIVAVEEQEHAQSVGETIAELMHEHPSRSIVLYIKKDLYIKNDKDAQALSARVFAQCWMPFGRRQQICCEEIEITAPEHLLEDVPKLLLGLTVPDLPVVLWIRCPNMATHAEFRKIFPLSNKIVIDSDSFDDPARGYEFVAEMDRRGVNIVDLAWTRLTRWREMVSEIFEDERNRPHLEQITSVTIIHRDDTIGIKYLASWFRHAIPHAEVRFELTKNAGQGIAAIEFNGPGFSASLTVEDGSSAVLKVNELTQRTAMPATTEQSLLREELGIIGIDPVFRRCFE